MFPRAVLYPQRSLIAVETSAFVDGRGAESSAGRRPALNQLINVAVAEKMVTLRTEDYFHARRERIAKQLSALWLGRGMEIHRCLGTNFRFDVLYQQKSVGHAKSHRRQGRQRKSRNVQNCIRL